MDIFRRIFFRLIYLNNSYNKFLIMDLYMGYIFSLLFNKMMIKFLPLDTFN